MAETFEQTAAVEQLVFDEMHGVLHSCGAAALEGQFRDEFRGLHLMRFEEGDGQKRDLRQCANALFVNAKTLAISAIYGIVLVLESENPQRCRFKIRL